MQKKLKNQDAYKMLTAEEKMIYQMVVIESEGIKNRTTFYNRLRNDLTVGHLTFLSENFGFVYNTETCELTRTQNSKNYEKFKEKVIRGFKENTKDGFISCSRPANVPVISS